MKGIAGNNPANDPDKKPVKSYSKFLPNYSHLYTALFGKLTPSYVSELVQADRNFQVRCQSDIDTFSLQAPVMTPVKHNKAYFFVPLRAILPHNADLVVTNPLTGEDIEPLKVNAMLDKHTLRSYIYSYMSKLNQVIANLSSGTPGTGSFTHTNIIGAVLSFYNLFRHYLSDASIFNRLGISMNGIVAGPWSTVRGRQMTFDECFEHMFSWIREHFDEFTVQFVKFVPSSQQDYAASPTVQLDSLVYTVDMSLNTPSGVAYSSGMRISFRQLLELLDDHILGDVSASVLNSNSQALSPYIPAPAESADLAVYSYMVLTQPAYGVTIPDAQRYINISRIVAYQIACADFFTNDAVDYLYNAELWHNNQRAWLTYTGINTFQYNHNGIGQYYDVVSGYLLSQALQRAYGNTVQFNTAHSAFVYSQSTGNTISTVQTCAIAYFENIIGINRSLKYRDYFVGSKTAPMAVGNVDVQVNNNVANVVDITRNIQLQRFLNQVNRIGRSLKEYSRGIFGANPMPDPRNAIFVGSTSETIGAEETENTGAAQLTDAQTITSKFRNESSRFGFSFDANEYGYALAITYFDVVRPYVDTTDRPVFHRDRFDMFNPFMQQIGDQAVYGSELYPTQYANVGYQLRYSEYKQRTDRASGGFRSFLPGFAFINDRASMSMAGNGDIVIGPDFIRARSAEFDQFYISLPNYSDAGYFHFIIRDDYSVSADRPMEAAPSIL